MIYLNLGVDEADGDVTEHANTDALKEFLLLFGIYNGIWLMTDADTTEVFVTDNASTLYHSVDVLTGDKIFIQRYQSFEDAYSVALLMRDV